MPLGARLNRIGHEGRQAISEHVRYRQVAFVQGLYPKSCPGPSAYASSRHFGSTGVVHSVFSDIFSRASRNLPQKSYAATVTASISSRRIDLLTESYDDLVRSLVNNPSTIRLSSIELVDIMNDVCNRPETSSLHLLQRLYDDLVPIHKIDPLPAHHRAMLLGLIAHGKTQQAFELARRNSATGDVITNREWMAIIRAAVKNNPTLVEDVFLYLKHSGELSEEMFSPLLGNLLDKPGRMSVIEIDNILNKIREAGLEPGVWCEAELVPLYLKVGDIKQAKDIIDRWHPNDSDDTFLRQKLWDLIISVEIKRDDASAIEQAVRTMADVNVPVQAHSYLVLRKVSNNVSEEYNLVEKIEDVMRATDKVPSSSSWDQVIRDFLTQGGSLRTAFEAYQAAREKSLLPTEPLALSLIERLCAYSPPKLVEAIEVYHDLMAAAGTSVPDASFQPTVKIYESLLSACALSHPSAVNMALTLVKDINVRNIRLMPEFLTTLCISLMKDAGDHSEAYDVFDQIIGVGRLNFSEMQYDCLISAFLALSYPGSIAPPPDLVIRMMTSMRRAGHRPGTRIITSLLKSYASLAKVASRLPSGPSNNFQLAALLSAIRDINSIVKIDPLIEVDVPLLTSLMDAFSSAGAFSEALDVWDEIVRRRAQGSGHDEPTTYGPAISVIIDTCGHAELLSRARRIWAWAQRHRLVTDRRNWEAYVECLSRLGQLDEATTIVCDGMGVNGAPSPTPDTVMIVLKFAKRRPEDMRHVIDRIKKRFPVWRDGFK